MDERQVDTAAILERIVERVVSVAQPERILLFGSAARDETQENSDVDIVVKLQKQDLFNMIGIKQDLEETLGVHVDLISYREKMNPFLKNRIDTESLYV